MNKLVILVIAVVVLGLNCSKDTPPSRVEIVILAGDSVKVGSEVYTFVRLPQALRDMKADENTQIQINWDDDVRAGAVDEVMQTLAFHNFKKLSVQTKAIM